MPENDLSMEVGRSENVHENIQTMKSHSFCHGLLSNSLSHTSHLTTSNSLSLCPFPPITSLFKSIWDIEMLQGSCFGLTSKRFSFYCPNICTFDTLGVLIIAQLHYQQSSFTKLVLLSCFHAASPSQNLP
jgi:hypothetical protein